MNKAELGTYVDLGHGNHKLIDPKYAHNPQAAENDLKERVRKCWKDREHLPGWIQGYIKKWAAQTHADTGVERAPTERSTDSGDLVARDGRPDARTEGLG